MMYDKITVKKTGGKHIIANVSFPSRKKVATISVVQTMQGQFFYMQQGIYGQIFNRYSDLQKNYAFLRNVTEYEFLGGN